MIGTTIKDGDCETETTLQHGNGNQYWQYTSKRGWVVRDRGTPFGACPRCGGPLYRTPRRLIERLFNFQRDRFQCVSQPCSREGSPPIENILP